MVVKMVCVCVCAALKDMAVCHQPNSSLLSDLNTTELSGLNIGVPSVTAGTQLPATAAVMTPPSSQKNSCTKSISIPEEDSGYGQD